MGSYVFVLYSASHASSLACSCRATCIVRLVSGRHCQATSSAPASCNSLGPVGINWPPFEILYTRLNVVNAWSHVYKGILAKLCLLRIFYCVHDIVRHIL